MATTREILWYGRGGQGAFSAAKLLGAAYALSGQGRYAMAFPSFGPERRGAPVRAFTKLSSAPVNDRSAVTVPDHIVCLDETLLADLGSTPIRTEGSLIVVDDAVTELAREVLGRPIVNTVLLALLALELGDVSEADIELGIAETMPARIQAKNVELVRAVFERADELSGAVHRAADIAVQRKPKPHERNVIEGGAEYMDLLGADGFSKPHKAYVPGGAQGGDAQ